MITFPNYLGIVANYKSAWVTVRDMNIVQAAPGIAFHRHSHDMTVSNVDVSFNYPAGIVTQATRATFTEVSGFRNTMQLAKVDYGGVGNTFTHVSARQNPAQGIKVTGNATSGTIIRDSSFTEGDRVPAWAATYSGQVQGIDIEQGAHGTTVLRNRITGMARGLMLYQVDASGRALSGTLVKYNYFADNLHAVVLWDGRVGADGSGSSMFKRNIYVHNGNALFALAGTTNKVFRRETVWRSYSADGTGRAAFLVQGSGTRIVIRDSIVAKSPTYAIRSTSGALVMVKYTDVYGYARAAAYGNVRWLAGIRHRNPRFLSATNGSANFMVLPSGSILRHASSTGGRIGAR